MSFTQFPEISSRVFTSKQIFGLLNRFNYNSHISQLSLFIFIVSSLLLPTAQAASYWLDENGTSLTTGLVGYWKFSESSGGTTNDSSGYNNHGTLTNMNINGNATSGWTTDCKYGSCLRFDGVNDYVDLGNPASLDFSGKSAFTIEAWVKATGPTSPDKRILIDLESEIYIERYQNSNDGYINIQDADNVNRYASFSYTMDAWQHIVMRYDGSELSVWSNGVKGNVWTGTTTIYSGPQTQNKIGSQFGSTQYFWNGTIDEVRIYNRTLSADEISQLYQAGRIRLANDFISVRADPYIQLNLTNSTNNGLMKLVSEEIKLNNTPITSIYYANPLNNSYRVYYYDWDTSRWLIWMNTTNNATHGKPDFTKPIYKQAFKWMYSFNRTNFPTLNMTYVLTASDPFVRQIIDLTSVSGTWNLEMPLTVNQTEKRMCLSANYTDGKLSSWNERNCYEYGNPYSAYDAVWKMRSTVDFNDTGLVGYWKLDEGSGQAVKDLSGYNNNGTLTNMNNTGNNLNGSIPSGWTDGKYGNAAGFDGVNDYVDMGSSSLFEFGTSDASFELWLKPNSLSASSEPMLKWDAGGSSPWGWAFYLVTTGSGQFIGSDNTIAVQTGAGSITAGSWHHWIVTRTGNTFRAYLNGVLKDTQTYTASLSGADGKSLTIGARGAATPPTSPFNGTIDEVRIYNRALSADEILNHYQTQAIFYNSTYNIQSNEWNLTSQVNKTTDRLNVTFYLDNDYFNQNLNKTLELTIPDIVNRSNINLWYNASDNTWRNATELSNIGYGYWNYTVTDDNYGIKKRLNISYSLAGGDGYDYGIRDSTAGGSYWLDDTGKALTSGLVGYWKFSEAIDNITNDSSGYSNLGTFYGNNNGTLGGMNNTGNATSGWIDGKYGKALQFDGFDDGVTVPQNILGTGPSATVSMWIKPSNYTTGNTLGMWFTGEGGSEDFQFKFSNASGKVAFSSWNVTINSGDNILSLNTWHHIAGTYGTDGIKLYINGIQVGSSASTTEGVTNANSFYIGKKRTGYEFNGTMDDVRAYTRTLSAGEIQQLYQSSTDHNPALNDSGLVGYWDFNDGSGSGKAKDNSMWRIFPSNCKYGSCLQFDGVNDYVDAGNKSSLSWAGGEITISAWIKPDEDSSPTGGTDNTWWWVAKTNSTDDYYRLSYNDYFELNIYSNIVTCRTGINDNQFKAGNWYHVVGTAVNGSSQSSLYVNGVMQVCAGTGTVNIVESSRAPLTIGSNGRGSAMFNGSIDEVRIYNRSLSADEISQQYQAGRIRLANDFISVRADPYIQLNLTNSTNGGLMKLVSEEIKIDNLPISTIYPAATVNNSYKVYYYDWGNNSWKIWMKSGNNATHGMPDWLDTRYKQEFKWMYAFNRTGYPSVNYTYLMTASDPFVRIFVDTVNSTTDSHNLTLPIALQQNKSMLDAGLVGYWPMEEGAGSSAYDYSNYKNTGSLGSSGYSWVSGTSCNSGSCINITSSSYSQNFASATSLPTTAFTISLWISFNNLTTSSGQNLIYNNGGYGACLSSAGWSFRGLNGDGPYGWTFTSPSTVGNCDTINIDPITLNTWTYVAVIYNGTNIISYLNGIQEGIGGNVGTFTNGNNLVIVAGGATYKIDEFRIYNRALSAGEIWQRYQLGQTRLKAGNYYYVNSTSDNILFTTQNFKPSYRGNLSSPTASEFNITEDSTLDKITYDYRFNSTLNRNFMFSLGTTGYQNTNLNITNFAVNRTLGYSNETLESVANSTLTWYDFWDGSLVGYWKFNDGSGSGTAYDWSGYNNTGTLTNMNTTGNRTSGWNSTDCKYGSCLRFDGVNDYVGATNPSGLSTGNSSRTISYWFKANVFTGLDIPVIYGDSAAASNRNFWVGFTSTLVYTSFSGGANEITESWTPSTDRWYHLAGTWDGTTLRTYLDGVLYDSGTGFTPTTDAEMLRIGGMFDIDANYQFNGTIDEVKVYSRALSSDEVKATYLATKDDYPSWSKSENASGTTMHTVPVVYNYDGGAVGIWKFEENGGFNASDSSGYGNIGTLTNMNTTGNRTSGWNSTDCKYGSCLRFDGINDYVSISASSDTTIEYWKKNITDTSWIHIVNSSGTLYVNGATGSGQRVYVNKTVIGIDSVGNYFNGTIDEVRIYPRALSPWEIKEHYSKEVSKYVDDYNTGIYRYFGMENTTANFSSPIDHSTVLALRFDEVSGSTIANDSSKFNNDGTLTNMNTTGNATSGWNSTDCKYGSCLRFDGVNDYVNVIRSVSLEPSQLTIELWIYLSKLGSNQDIIDKHYPDATPTGYYISLNTTNQINFDISNGTSETAYRVATNVLNSNTWYHIVGIYDSTSASIYLNGNLIQSATGIGAISYADVQNLIIGASYDVTARFFNGTIDEVRIYNRALSADEIRDNYLRGMPKRVIDGKTHYVRNDNDFAYTRPTTAFNLTDTDSSTLQDYDTKLLRLEVNYTDDSEGKTTYQFSNTTDNKYGLQSMSKPWIVLMNYQTNDQPLFVTTSKKTLSSIPLKVTADENEAITKLTFNQSFNANTNLTLAYGYLGNVNTRSDTG